MVITGQEGVGKSTVVRALLRALPGSAQIDAEDVGQVNPWTYDEAFRALHRRNVADLTRNFWQAGYGTVLAASFVDTHPQLRDFLALLGGQPELIVVQLCASRSERDRRRTRRAKPTSRAARHAADDAVPEDRTLAAHADEYDYLRVDTDGLSVERVVAVVLARIGR
ncbi:hypothetical protein ACIB24_18070 [Spongisporangium articulatum]|uniref:AAA domain-containing protein n=1 Tax=Spongisporangium articulatum TaxID=3362603 RepID=A0ABW8ARF9_9ACTN